MKIVSKDNRDMLEENRVADVTLAEGVSIGFAKLFCDAVNAVYKNKKTDRWFTATIEDDDYVLKRLGKNVIFPREWLSRMTLLWR